MYPQGAILRKPVPDYDYNPSAVGSGEALKPGQSPDFAS